MESHWCFKVAAITAGLIGIGLFSNPLHAQSNADSLTAQSAQRVVAAGYASLQGCYERALKKSPRLATAVTMKIVINKRGHVRRVARVSGLRRGTRFERCLRRRLKQWKFPRPVDGSTVLEIPLNFSLKA